MTLTEIAYNLLNLVRGGRSNNDEHISLDQIKFNVAFYRAMFIRRDYGKNGFTSRHVEQDLGCVALEPVDATQCCALPSTCVVYKSVQPLPKTIRYNFEEAITYVGDITGRGTIPMVNSNTIEWLPYDKYTKGKMKAYMIQDHLYVYNAEGLEVVNVRGVFEEPRDAKLFDGCVGGICWDDDKNEYPISMDTLHLINQGILQGELALLSGSFSDTKNDRQQDPQTIKGSAAPQK